MAEGLHTPDAESMLRVAPHTLNAAMVRVRPRTRLVLDLVDTDAEARRLARNESEPDGTDRWYRYFTREDLARVADPAFRMGMVRWEFSRLVQAGARFPAEAWLDGGGSGFCVSDSGLVLTNYHLATGEVAFHGREEGALNVEVRCRALEVDVAVPGDDGRWSWKVARHVSLVSNPPAARAIVDDGEGPARLREDWAVLRVDPPPGAALSLASRPVELNESVVMAGFPLRTARSVVSLQRLGYTDADGTLRCSSGRVTAIDGPDYFTSDVDGSMGNSGSPAIDRDGRVIGMFSRASGDGPRNAFEYGHVQRVFLSAALLRGAVDGAC